MQNRFDLDLNAAQEIQVARWKTFRLQNRLENMRNKFTLLLRSMSNTINLLRLLVYWVWWKHIFNRMLKFLYGIIIPLPSYNSTWYLLTLFLPLSNNLFCTQAPVSSRGLKGFNSLAVATRMPHKYQVLLEWWDIRTMWLCKWVLN